MRSLGIETMFEIVKVCRCRPHDGGATHTGGRRTQTFREPDVRTRMRLPYSRLSTIEVPVHLRSPGEMVPVQASARPQPVPRRPCRAAPSRRLRTQDQEEAAAPVSYRECAGPRSARWQEAG